MWRMSLIKKSALQAFMLCMTIKLVSAVGLGTVVTQEPYVFCEAPEERVSWLVNSLVRVLNCPFLYRCIALDESAVCGSWSNCSCALSP